MKRLFCILVISLLIASIFTGCDDSTKNVGNSIKPQPTQVSNKNTAKYKFALYLVKGMSLYQAEDTNIDKLVLEDEPILNEKNITAYYWKSNVFQTNKSILDMAHKVSTHGAPAVLVANGERIYLVALWTSLSSLNSPKKEAVLGLDSSQDIIQRVKNDGYTINLKSDDVCLQIGRLTSGVDYRNDMRIHDALKDAGILKE